MLTQFENLNQSDFEPFIIGKIIEGGGMHPTPPPRAALRPLRPWIFVCHIGDICLS